MGIVTTDDKNYKDIAEAIRGKTGKTDLLLPSEMAGEISSITSGGEVIENEQYIRPTEWLAMPERDESRDQIFILVAIYEDTNLPITINTTGECTVSWGDINDTVVTGSANEFTFTWDNVSPDSLFDLWGYRQSLIKIECDKDLLTNLTITSDLDFKEFILYANSPTLNIIGTCLNLTQDYQLHFGSEVLNPVYPKTAVIKNIIFENVKFNSMNRLFQQCTNLLAFPEFKLTETDNYNANQFAYGAQNVRKPINIKQINGELGSLYQNCTRICTEGEHVFDDGVKLIETYLGTNIQIFKNTKTDNASSIYGICKNCNALIEFNVSFKTLTDATGMVNGCKLLTKVNITDDERENAVTITNAFQNCTALKTVKFNALIATGSADSLFLTSGLQYIENANFKYITNARRLFGYCPSLEIVMNLNLENSTNNGECFQNCSKLKKITFAIPECIKSSINFNNCSSLTSEMLNNVFETGLADLTGQDTQTITITGCGGASECDVTIAQSKNWTVVR